MKLRRETSAAQVAELLRSAILRGDFPPGTMLRQEPLAQKIGVSPAPLREAFRQLEGEGLVKSDQYKGVCVATISAGEARDAMEIRILLELHCLDLAIASHTKTSIVACQKSIDAALADAHFEQHWFDHNWGFHRLLYEPANRPYILTTIKSCLRRCQFYLRITNPPRVPKLQSLAEHQPILDAVASKDRAKARELLRAHLDRNMAIFETAAAAE